MNELKVSYSSFVEQLLEAVPELKAVYDTHIEDYDELFEHVFLGEVTRIVEQTFNKDPGSECLTRLLKFIDKSFLSEDDKLQELISVSFLENLSQTEECYTGIKALLSDALNEELSSYENLDLS